MDREFNNFGGGYPMPRISQRQIQATAVKPSALSQNTLINTTAETLGPISLANGVSLSLTSLLFNAQNPNYRLGGVPYSIVFFEDNLNVNDIIGASVTGYKINGPMAMPTFTPEAYVNSSGSNVLGGNNGNNLVYLTEITNNTGVTHDIYIVTNTRVYLPLGGDVD